MEGTASIMAMVGAFIGVAIILAVGIQILGNVQTSTPCTTLPGGFHISIPLKSGTPNSTQIQVPNSSTNATGWGLQCFNNASQTQNSYQLLGVALIVIAAIIILVIVKLL